MLYEQRHVGVVVIFLLILFPVLFLEISFAQEESLDESQSIEKSELTKAIPTLEEIIIIIIFIIIIIILLIYLWKRKRSKEIEEKYEGKEEVVPTPTPTPPPPTPTPPPPTPTPSPPNPVLNGPTPIVRGTNGNYVVNNAQGATFANWRFAGGGINFNRPGNNNVSNWSGTMVQSGTISVDVTINGVTHNLSLAVVVTARPWTENAPAIPLGRSGNGILGQPPRRLGDLGVTVQIYDNNVGEQIPNGPNQGFNWLPLPPVVWHPSAFSNDALYDVTHPFRRAHDPALRGAVLPVGRQNIADIIEDVEAHEGIIAPPPGAPAGWTSHWGNVVDHLAIPANQINIPLEDDVTHNTNENLATYRTRTFLIMMTGASPPPPPPTRGIFGALNAAGAFPGGHPPTLLPAPGMAGIYFDYPFITQRNHTMRRADPPFPLIIDAPIPVVLTSTNPGAATVNAAGVITPVGAGQTQIRATNADGDWDEITVRINP